MSDLLNHQAQPDWPFQEFSPVNKKRKADADEEDTSVSDIVYVFSLTFQNCQRTSSAKQVFSRSRHSKAANVCPHAQL